MDTDGLALMGFGFVVARFGLFLRELAAAQHDLSDQVHRVLGSGGNRAYSHWRNRKRSVSAQPSVRLIKSIEGRHLCGRPSLVGCGRGALLLASVGLGMAVYLVFIR